MTFPKAPKRNYAHESKLLENKLVESTDLKYEIIDFYKRVWPRLKELAKNGDVEEMIKQYGPYAFLSVTDLAFHGQSEKVRLAAALELMHMHTGKPIQRSITLTKNLDSMSEKELDILLTSYLKELTPEQRQLAEQNVIEITAIPDKPH